MATVVEIQKRLATVFEPAQATVLAEVIHDAYSDLVKTSDFNELKAIVKDLAEAQKRTEVRVEELAEAQKRTEVRVEELAEAQKQTQQSLQELAQEVRVLTRGLTETRRDLGGLSLSFSYALENEAYRMLPALLQERYGIVLKKRLIRTEIEGKEINFFGQATRDGQDVILIGEVKLRLDERRKRRSQDVFDELDEKIQIIRTKYPGETIIPVLVTHFATEGFRSKAEERGVIVVQSFEW
jgi:hypothetical protein